jgi:hypothetical protein
MYCYAAVVGKRRQPGIYVEILIRAPLERVWDLTQKPEVHQRWDLRFSSIEYLPKSNESDPQRFLYETRIGLGIAIRGTGESVATRVAEDTSATSSLQFASDDRLSLIREGAGYWRYIPTTAGLRFLTWYDYRVRFGAAGRLLDRIFHPLIGWATAWSFDRMRLWAERDIAPEDSLRLAAIHALSRFAIAAVWFWHGLVPKLLFHDPDERLMLARAGLPETWLPWVGVAEIALALMVLSTWRWRGMFMLQALLMLVALLAVAFQSPAYLTHAFNPVTLNLLVFTLAIIGWIASRDLPTASRCLRVDPRRTDGGQDANS